MLFLSFNPWRHRHHCTGTGKSEGSLLYNSASDSVSLGDIKSKDSDDDDGNSESSMETVGVHEIINDFLGL